MVKNPSKRLAIILIASIYISEAIVMILLSEFPNIPYHYQTLIDSTVLCLLIIPALFYFVVSPISKFVNELEKAATDSKISAVAFESNDSIVITNENFIVEKVNHAFELLTGRSNLQVINKDIFDIFVTSTEISVDKFRKQLESNGYVSDKTNYQDTSGKLHIVRLTITAIKNSLDKISHFLVNIVDITKIVEAEQQINQLTYFNSITGLPNKTNLLNKLNTLISIPNKNKPFNVLLFISLDRYEEFLNTYGTQEGNLLLNETSRRIRKNVKSKDFVGQYSTKVFAVIISELDDLENAKNISKSIIDRIHFELSKPYSIAKNKFYTTSSVGASIFSEGNTEEIIRNADIAFREAQNTSSTLNTLEFYDAKIREKQVNRSMLLTDLENAVSDNQFLLYYQIQVDEDFTPIGAEALIRWQHPIHGMISPINFINLAEYSSKIIEIGGWVIDQACKQLSIWKNNPLTKNLVISVNVSPKQFMDGGLKKSLETSLKRYKVDSSKLKLEITESMPFDNIQTLINKLEDIKNIKGIKLSMDDFGTGYSSLSYLMRLPLDQIKIDQSFVNDLPNSDLVVSNIIEIANKLGMDLIAEGVEHKWQVDYLASKGCHKFQGYLFGKPLPIKEFENLLTQKF